MVVAKNFTPRKIPLLCLLQTALLLETGCGAPSPLDFQSLLLEQPYVLEARPADRAALPDPAEIELEFSERIDLESLGGSAVALVSGLPSEEVLSDAEELTEQLDSGELLSVPLQYFLEDDERRLTLVPANDLQAGVYLLVVTPRLRSVRGLPFNQRPGESPASFVARYTYGDVPLTSLDPLPGGAPGPGGPVFGAPPEALVISELLYDGKVSDTDGENFVELYGTPGGDISLFQILFINGAGGAETERITLPAGSLLPEDGVFLIADLKTGSTTASLVPGADFLDQFDPQNGPDGVQLLDREGNLVDTIVYGDGSPALAANGLPLGEGTAAPDVAGGHSLSRIEGRDSQDNGADFVDLTAPTPGIL
ncbi:MAG: lamin tail domain-containing protein [Deltaproteobacteria bacterium]|nr:lamin tail domain-containing protein [Deltaproteobacteria bacterium]